MTTTSAQPPLDDFAPECPSPPIRLHTRADVVSIVPYLLGFVPQESLVAVLVDAGRVVVTARLDLVQADEPRLAQLVAVLLRDQPAAQVLLVGYSSDPNAAAESLGMAEVAFGAYRVLDSLMVVDGRLRSRSQGGWREARTVGGEAGEAPNAVSAAAVYAGMSVLSSRDELRRLVAGPAGERLDRAREIAGDLRDSLPAGSAAHSRLDHLLSKALESPDALSVPECLELGLLIADIQLRDRAWLGMSRRTAEQHLRVWLRIVREMPEEHSVPALALVGAAAWLTGNGALQVIALERGLELDASYSMLRLLSEVNAVGAPPSLWDHMVT